MGLDLNTLKNLIDQIKNGSITPNDILGNIQNTTDPLPSDSDILNIAKELENSIVPVPMILNNDTLNNLVCLYDGEELGNRILWEILYENKELNNIKGTPDFSNNEAFDKFMEINGLSTQLSYAKEMASDNLDLNSLGIIFNNSNIKKRVFNIGPLSFNIDIITNQGTPLFFNIPSIPLDINSILNTIEQRINDFSINSGCNNGSLNSQAMLDLLKNLLEKDNNTKKLNNIFDIVDEIFCQPNIPINPDTGEPLFNQSELTEFIQNICNTAQESPTSQAVPEISIEDMTSCVNQTLSQTKNLFNNIQSNGNLITRYNKAEKEIEEILYHYQIIQNFFSDVYIEYNKKVASKSTGNLLLTINDINNSSNYYINLIKSFSSRFSKTSFTSKGYAGISFGISYPNGLGNPIPYQSNVQSVNPLSLPSYPAVDFTKLQIGMEFSDTGILADLDNTFLKKYENYVYVYNENPKVPSNFYSFVGEIENTDHTKDTIISKINSDHGYLYSNLIEISASPWTFFNSSERGDNDARKPENIKPSSTDIDGNPNQTFKNFWNNFKYNWDKKYTEKQETINSEIINIRKKSADFIDTLTDYYIAFGLNNSILTGTRGTSGTSGTSGTMGTSGTSGAFGPNGGTNSGLITLKNITENIDSIVTNIQNILLIIGQQIQILSQKNSADNISAEANSIQCGNSVAGNPLDCPSQCCGSAGSNFGNSLYSSSPSQDCPTFYTKCYWKEFAKNATNVGILPILNGIPPVEDSIKFSPDLGMRYWPVGYLPPSFIPLPPPIVNPLDGMPFIRIPLPMVWETIDPVVIPLPIGIIVIFIPMIGGFIPSPLVFFHDFLTSSSIFLLGVRGFRFIPRKSDPILNDPAERYKKFLSYGIPNYLFPFSNLGKDNMDSQDRLKKEVSSNLIKQMDNIQKNVDFSEIQNIQDQITNQSKTLQQQALILKRNRAINGSTQYNSKISELNSVSSSFDQQKEIAIKNSIKKYISDIIDLPDIKYPKQSKNLISEIPESVKSIDNINSKKKLGILSNITTINLQSRVLNNVNKIDIQTPAEFDTKNSNLSSESRIVAIYSVTLGEINQSPDDFNKLKSLIFSTIGQYLNSGVSPINPISLSLFNAELNSIPKIGGDSIQIPGSLNIIPNNQLDSLKSYFSNNLSLSSNDVIRVSSNNSIDGNKILRVKDLRLFVKNVLNNGMNKFPMDLKNFNIPNGANSESVANSYSKISSSIEIPAFPPKKSGDVISPLGIGGIPQITIPGSSITKILVDGIGKKIDSLDISTVIPGGLSTFQNLTTNDIKSISKNIAVSFTSSFDIPQIKSVPSIPLTSRPQGYDEFIMNFLPMHPASDIAFTEEWTKNKNIPKIPIQSGTIQSLLELQHELLFVIPWPVVVMLGRGIINILNPLYNREDLPRWDRMTLKNPFFVVFLDEFIRSAADISGGFKFFVGADKLLYPLPDLEINLGFGTKIEIN